ncbi:MAG: hypothetical protein SFX18_15850 [Pirellulales bacterium]|nr:hypothetical protein [Pirellulales bacterium]
MSKRHCDSMPAPTAAARSQTKMEREAVNLRDDQLRNQYATSRKNSACACMSAGMFAISSWIGNERSNVYLIPSAMWQF